MKIWHTGLLIVLMLSTACGGDSTSTSKLESTPASSDTAGLTPTAVVDKTVVEPTATNQPNPKSTPVSSDMVDVIPTATIGKTVVDPTATNQPDSTSDPAEESTTLQEGFVAVTLNDTSTARYMIRERLARLELPNDAIGQTEKVSGSIIFDAQGSIQDSSHFIVNVATLVSDESKRDRYVRNNTLNTAIYPEVYFKLLSIEGLNWPLPYTGSNQVKLIGEITIMDVTRSIAWDSDVIFSEDSLSGVARTTVLFEDFSMNKPSLSFILSVADEIRLELDFMADISRG